MHCVVLNQAVMGGLGYLPLCIAMNEGGGAKKEKDLGQTTQTSSSQND